MRVRDGRRVGWFWLPDAVIDEYGAELGAGGVAVLAVLARSANGAGRSYRSVADIGALVGMSEPTVRRYLRRLEDLGLLRVDRRHRLSGEDTTSEYVLLDTPGAAAREPDRGKESFPYDERILGDRGQNSCPLEVRKPPIHIGGEGGGAVDAQTDPPPQPGSIAQRLMRYGVDSGTAFDLERTAGRWAEQWLNWFPAARARVEVKGDGAGATFLVQRIRGAAGGRAADREPPAEYAAWLARRERPLRVKEEPQLPACDLGDCGPALAAMRAVAGADLVDLVLGACSRLELDGTVVRMVPRTVTSRRLLERRQLRFAAVSEGTEYQWRIGG